MVSILLLLCSSLCALLLPLDILPLAQTSPFLALDTDGTTYLTSNDAIRSRIIAVGQGDIVRFCYQERSRSDGEISAIGPLTVSDGVLYFIRNYSKTNDVTFHRWELVSYDPVVAETAVVLGGETVDLQVTDVAIADRVIYLSGIESSNQFGASVDTIALYRATLDDPDHEMEAVSAVDAPDGATVLSAVHGGGNTVCALLANGRLLRVNGRQTETVYLPDGCSSISAISATNGYLWARSATGGSFLTGTAAYLRLRETTENALSGVAMSNQLTMRILTEPQGQVALAHSVGEETQHCTRLHVPLPIRFQLCLPVIALADTIVLLLLVLTFVGKRLVSSHRLCYHITAEAIGLTFCLFVLLFASVIAAMVHTQNEKAEDQATWAAQNMVSQLQNSTILNFYSNGDLSTALSADSSSAQNASAQATSSSTSTGLLASHEQEIRSLLNTQPMNVGSAMAFAVYMQPQDTPSLVYASRGQVDNDPVVQNTMRATWQQGYAVTGQTRLDGRRTILCAVPVRQFGDMSAVVVCLVTTVDLLTLLGKPLQLFSLFAILLFLFCALLFALLIRKQLQPLEPLVEQMDKLAMGNTNLDTVKCADNELGHIWHSLKELSVGVAIHDYETAMTLEACRRFVPHGLEHLLSRSSITEVSFGDLTVADGTIGLVTVSNNDHMRTTLDDAAFMQYVNRCFLTISKSIRPEGGMLLTSGFDLSAIRILFHEEPDKGVRAFLSLLGAAQDAASSAQPLDCFTLLHKTRFLYGVAGAQDEAFPYLASAEISFFSNKLPLFAEIGCRLVVTDAFLNTLTGHYTTRYIGFFSSPEGRILCKLYEILDCYGEIERTTREKYDARLQEAIRCFYQNDFYLARNLFLAILRLCPGDGVARWYLFACEHYFNAGAGEEARYDLFGVHQLPNAI